MKKQKRIGITIIVVFICLLPMLGAVALCSYQVEQNLEAELQNTLRDVAEQNNVTVQKEIEARFSLLTAFAQEIESGVADSHFIIDSARNFVDNYRFERIGIVSPTGLAYTTDGYVEDVSYWDFYDSAMAGKTVVVDVEETEGPAKRYVNQFSVPVYTDETRQEVEGVLYATYKTEWFEEILNTKAFEGRGYSCIVRNDGAVIAHSADSPILGERNFFAYLEKSEKPEAIKNLKERFRAEKSGIGRFGSEVQDFYYTPLKLENGQLQWYMITLVPDDVLAERLRPIKDIINQIFMILAIIVGCGIAIFMLTYLVRRKELWELAYKDELTRGYNYTYFQKKFKKKRGAHGYILAMDISGFKIINSTCGVAMGDEVLKSVWRILLRSIKGDELTARLYADRFILFWSEEERTRICERLEHLIEDIEKISSELDTPQIVPVIGVYETNTQQHVETSYGNAVQAKHLVKGRRDRNYAFYEEVDHERVLEKRVIEDSFEQAISDKQFEIWYQPKYNALTGELSGAEALVRWRKADGVLMPPIKFIPVYEKNGMIPRLDEYIFRAVCMQQKQWLQEGHRVIPISVNISRASLYYMNLVEKYKAIAAEYGVEPKLIQLEITESATVGNSEAAGLIEQFHLAGFKMLLDDFGSGYSSLSTLNMMHFDIMKLDKSLIDYIGDANGEKLLLYIIRLGQNLGLEITAEGVETKEQVAFLQKLRCDEIQGYYFAKPLPVEEFGKLLNT